MTCETDLWPPHTCTQTQVYWHHRGGGVFFPGGNDVQHLSVCFVASVHLWRIYNNLYNL